jgi:peptidoglycan/xylan/chitin deacetylase (PgdA/CDA1 family)
MRTLAAEGYRSIDLEQWIRAGRPAVDRGFAIAFDDGLRSMLPACDLLLSLRFSASIFVVTDHVGTTNAWRSQPRHVPTLATLSWRELAQLHASGFGVGAHSRTHRRLGNPALPGWQNELVGSRAVIEDRLGTTCRLFAYPYGWAHRLIQARAAGLFDACFSARPAISRDSDPLHNLPRIDAFDLRTAQRLKLFLQGELETSLWPRWRARWLRQQGLALASSQIVDRFARRQAMKLGSYTLEPHKTGHSRCLPSPAASATSQC